MKEMHLKQLKQLFSMGVLLIFLAGCGQSGALYLPEDKEEQETQQKPMTSENTSPASTTQTKQDQ